MTEIYFRDKITIDPKTKNANLSRSGVYQYMGKELGLNDNEIYAVHRPESTVYKTAELLNDYGTIPVLINHPRDFVDTEDDKNYKRGGVGNARVDNNGNCLVCNADIIGLTDDVKELLNKGQEVSLGYKGNIKACDCGDYDYEVEITDLNHLAIVDKGRAGGVCSIQDSVNNKQVILQELNNKKNKKATMTDKQPEITEEIKEEVEVEGNTEAAAEGEKEVTDAAPEVGVVEAPAEAEEGEKEAESDTEVDDKSEIDTEVKDSAELVDKAMVDQAMTDGMKIGREKAAKDFKDAMSLVNAGLVEVKELSDGKICESVDKAVLKLLDMKSFESDAERDAAIKLSVSQANRQTWNFSDTKHSSAQEYKKGSLLSDVIN